MLTPNEMLEKNKLYDNIYRREENNLMFQRNQPKANLEFFNNKLRNYGLCEFGDRCSADVDHFTGLDKYRAHSILLAKKDRSILTSKQYKEILARNQLYRFACTEWFGRDYCRQYNFIYMMLMEGHNHETDIGYDNYYLMMPHVLFDAVGKDLAQILREMNAARQSGKFPSAVSFKSCEFS